MKFKKIETIKWLQPGKLVIVYSPPRAGAASAKLLFRFKGPYRIKRQVRGALHLENLDGSPADTQNIRNCYPYRRENDALLQKFDKSLVVDDDNEDYSIDDWVIVDVTDDPDVPEFKVARISNVLGDGTYEIHFYETYSNVSISQRTMMRRGTKYTRKSQQKG